MIFLKSNLFKHGHSVPTFSIRGHYFNYFVHVQTTWAFRAHVQKQLINSFSLQNKH